MNHTCMALYAKEQLDSIYTKLAKLDMAIAVYAIKHQDMDDELRTILRDISSVRRKSSEACKTAWNPIPAVWKERRHD